MAKDEKNEVKEQEKQAEVEAEATEKDAPID